MGTLQYSPAQYRTARCGTRVAHAAHNQTESTQQQTTRNEQKQDSMKQNITHTRLGWSRGTRDRAMWFGVQAKQSAP